MGSIPTFGRTAEDKLDCFLMPNQESQLATASTWIRSKPVVGLVKYRTFYI